MRQLDHRQDVLVHGVDATRTDEAHQVEAAAAVEGTMAGGEQRLVVKEVPSAIAR